MYGAGGGGILNGGNSNICQWIIIREKRNPERRVYGI